MGLSDWVASGFLAGGEAACGEAAAGEIAIVDAGVMVDVNELSKKHISNTESSKKKHNFWGKAKVFGQKSKSFKKMLPPVGDPPSKTISLSKTIPSSKTSNSSSNESRT